MRKTTVKEKKNDRIGRVTTIVVHVLFLLVALFLVRCWKAPGPPYSNDSIGVVLDMGMSDLGSGKLKSESEPNENIETETVPESASNPAPEVEADEPVEPIEPIEAIENPDINVEDPIDVESDVSAATPTEAAVEPTPPTEVEDPVENPTETEDPNNNPNTMAAQSANNNGDTEGTVGDAGSPQSVDSSNVYQGDPGGGVGGEDGSNGDFKVSINGWAFNTAPKEDRIKHTGSITFEFFVNEFGEIERLRSLNSSFSPEEELMLKEKLKKELTFTQKNAGSAPPARTKGTLTWKFKAQ